MARDPLRLLGEVGRLFFQAPAADRIVEAAADSVAEGLEAEVGVRLLSADGTQLVPVIRVPTASSPGTIDASAAPWATVLATNQAYVTNNAAPPLGPGSRVVVPMRSAAGLVGTLDAARSEPGRPFTEGELTVLQEIADRLADWLAHGRQDQDRLAEMNAERAVAQGALEEAVTRFDALLAHAPIGFAFVDAQLRFRELNEPLAEMTGLSREDHLGRPMPELLAGLWPALAEHFRVVVETRSRVVDLEVSGQTAADPGIEHHWLAGLYPVVDRTQNLQGVGIVLVEITERHRAEMVTRLLGQMSQLLAIEQDLRATADSAAHVVIPEFADTCVLCLVTKEGDLEIMTGAARDGSGGVVTLNPERCPIDLDESSAMGALLAAGRPAVAERLDKPRPGSHLPEGFDELAREHDAISAVVVPLRSRGRFLGVAGFLYTAVSGRHYRPDDGVIGQQVAVRIGHVISNVALAEQAKRAHGRLELLAEAGTLLESELDVEARARAVARLAVPQFADHAAVYLSTGDGGLRFAGGAHREPDIAARMNSMEWPALDVTGPSAPATAVRTGQSVLRPFQPGDSALRLTGADPDMTRALTMNSLLAVPLKGKDQPLGALFFAVSNGTRRYSAEDVTLGEELARLAAPAISNAIRYEQERITGETLQRSLLPRGMPELPGVEVATRYLPGTTGLQVGGDWYDVVELDNGAVVLAIGDVVGHSIDAAVSMGRFRTVLQFSARQSRTPEEILGQINEFMCSAFENDMATLLAIVYNPATGQADVASAGHLPPLLVDPDGTSQLLELRPGIPLGVSEAAWYESVAVEVDAGSTVVLYTDGLVERRGETLDDGLSRLAHNGRHPAGDPAVVADRLLEGMLPREGTDDDVALLVARISIANGRLSLDLEADTAVLARARYALRAWLRALGCDEDETGDIVLAVNEAVANAIEHAYSNEVPGRVTVTGRRDGPVISLVVADRGQWRAPSAEDNRGRGITIMQAVMDSVEISHDGGGVRVELRKQLQSVQRGVVTAV